MLYVLPRVQVLVVAVHCEFNPSISGFADGLCMQRNFRAELALRCLQYCLTHVAT